MNVVLLPLAFLFGYLGYREAAKHKARYGTSPWNVSPVVWGVIVFATGILIGGLLLWAACRSDRKGHEGSELPMTTAAPRESKRRARREAPMTTGRGRPGSVL